MNVLVYNGPGTSPESVRRTVDTLRLLLEPYYAVSPVSTRALETEPWSTKTAAVVFPGGADLPYVRECKKVVPKLRNFLAKEGGLYIGICAGGYFGASSCEFAQGDPSYEVTGPRDLKLFPGIARGPAFAGFKYNEEAGARTAKLKVNGVEGFEEAYSYYNGGAVFVDAQKYPNVEVLAEYSEPIDVPCSDDSSTQDEKAAAVVLCSVGKGRALLMGPHPEYSAKDLRPMGEDWYDNDVITKLKEHEEARFRFMKEILMRAGLKCNSTVGNPGNPDLTPLFVFTRDNTMDLESFYGALKAEASDENAADDHFHISGETDEFDVYRGYHHTDECNKALHDMDPAEATKQIIFPAKGEGIPDEPLALLFDIKRYFEFLSPSNKLGSVLVHGDVVTSTSLIVEQNKALLRALPEDSVILNGSIQLLGRGRGGSTWVNPKGVLASTTAINLPAISPVTGQRTPVVFVQYLAMLAYCKAIRKYDPGYEDLPVRIKWPNDLYAVKPEYYYNRKLKLVGRQFGKDIVPLSDVEPAFVKISGLLVLTNFIHGKYSLLLGCGVNVSNEAPTTSLATWVEILNKERDGLGLPQLAPIEQEKLLAKYLNELDYLLQNFFKFGPSSILPEYYEYWLHSDQIVQLTDHNSVRAKLVGITDDYGLLIAKELALGSDTQFTGNTYHLQPDGNTFDIFKGLISKKA